MSDNMEDTPKGSCKKTHQCQKIDCNDQFFIGSNVNQEAQQGFSVLGFHYSMIKLEGK